jgi:hypothetical protein
MAKSKKPQTKHLIIGGLMYVFLFASAAGNIISIPSSHKDTGEELWNLKVMRDHDVAAVNTKPNDATILSLNAIVTDDEKREDTDSRMSFEKQVVTVHNVLIREVIGEDDKDYHIVVQDPQGHHMIAEIPDPECKRASLSKFEPQYSGARDSMNAYGNTFQHHLFDITGVLFRDRAHGQTGKADNNLEIHPVLKLRAVRTLSFKDF